MAPAEDTCCRGHLLPRPDTCPKAPAPPVDTCLRPEKTQGQRHRLRPKNTGSARKTQGPVEKHRARTRRQRPGMPRPAPPEREPAVAPHPAEAMNFEHFQTKDTCSGPLAHARWHKLPRHDTCRRHMPRPFGTCPLTPAPRQRHLLPPRKTQGQRHRLRPKNTGSGRKTQGPVEKHRVRTRRQRPGTPRPAPPEREPAVAPHPAEAMKSSTCSPKTPAPARWHMPVGTSSRAMTHAEDTCPARLAHAR